MPRIKQNLAVSADEPEKDANEISYVSASGKFSKGDFKLGPDGITNSPVGDGRVSDLRLDQLQLHEILGRGACSEVRRAVFIPTSLSIAVKSFDVSDKTRREQLIPELRALLGNQCPFMVSLYDAFFVDEKVYVALEYMDAGCLESLAKKKRQPAEVVAQAIIRQVLQGLYYLHKVRKQVHRDLKPGNILVNHQGLVKISDLGMAKQMNPEFGTAALAGTFLGTVMYMSPERMQGEQYSYSSDIWALGIIAFETAHYRHPYAGRGGSYIELMQTIIDAPLPEPAPELSPAFRDFYMRCCNKSPAGRATIEELTMMEWIKTAPGPEMVHRWLTE